MTLVLFISLVYPNGLNLRPAEFPRDNFFTGWVGSLYRTERADRERHGFGVRSIRTTLKKYHGELITRCEDQVFTIVIKFNF